MSDAREIDARWSALARRIESAGTLLTAEGTPDGSDARANGLRHLTRFLAAGLRVCIECNDPDHPAFGRMIDDASSWGLDNPDCNYSWARIRGDAAYRISGTRGSARHVEFQVNTGHMGDGHIPAFGEGEQAWRTVSFLSGDELVSDGEGRFELHLGGAARQTNWLPLDADASHVLVRQYFDDWEHEEPGRFAIERVGERLPPPALTSDRLEQHLATLHTWLDRGLASWDRMSRLLQSLEKNQLLVFDVTDDVDRPGLHGQSYGMGPFECEPDEAIVVSFMPPRCRMWSLSVCDFWLASLSAGTRQTSLNGHWAEPDADGAVRAVLSHRDPGVPNWIDLEGNVRGTLAIRFLLADKTPRPELTRVPLRALRSRLPETRRLGPEERSAVLGRRHRALQRRYGY